MNTTFGPHLLLGHAVVSSVYPLNPTIEVVDGPTGDRLFLCSPSEARRLAYLLLAQAQEVAPA